MAPSIMSSGSVPSNTTTQLDGRFDMLLGKGGPEHRFASQVVDRRVEFDGIVEVLMDSVTPGVDRSHAGEIARAIAAGCLGEQHLWLDLQLPNRAALRTLFEAYFSRFAVDNIMDMRWKKFIYKRLCRWGGFNTCRAPSCGVCTSYEECFGPLA